MTYGSTIIIYVLIMQNQTYDKISKSSKVTLCLRQQSTYNMQQYVCIHLYIKTKASKIIDIGIFFNIIITTQHAQWPLSIIRNRFHILSVFVPSVFLL